MNILRWLRGIGDMKGIVSIGVHGNSKKVAVSNKANEHGTEAVKQEKIFIKERIIALIKMRYVLICTGN